MFCVKCGAEIKSSDLHCSKCGAVNENYRPQKDESKFSFLNKEKQKDEEVVENLNDIMPKLSY